MCIRDRSPDSPIDSSALALLHRIAGPVKQPCVSGGRSINSPVQSYVLENVGSLSAWRFNLYFQWADAPALFQLAVPCSFSCVVVVAAAAAAADDDDDGDDDDGDDDDDDGDDDDDDFVSVCLFVFLFLFFVGWLVGWFLSHLYSFI